MLEYLPVLLSPRQQCLDHCVPQAMNTWHLVCGGSPLQARDQLLVSVCCALWAMSIHQLAESKVAILPVLKHGSRSLLLVQVWNQFQKANTCGQVQVTGLVSMRGEGKDEMHGLQLFSMWTTPAMMDR